MAGTIFWPDLRWCKRPSDKKFPAEDLGGAAMHAAISGHGRFP